MGQTTVFSSADLPGELDDRRRFSLWRDMFSATFGNLEMERPDDRPFAMRCEFARFGTVGFGQFEGTCNMAARTKAAVRADGDDSFVFVVNRRPTRMALVQNGRDIVLEPGAAGIVTNMEEGVFHGDPHNSWQCLRLPYRELVDRVANVEDLIGTTLRPGSAPLRHLQFYLAILLASDHCSPEPELALHIDRMLIDLVALTLGTDPETAHLACLRSLRAVRLQSVIGEIKRQFTNPNFSQAKVARKLGVSTRYVQDLLHETGVQFRERVLALRLEKARTMLQGAADRREKIIDIAYACGFNDLSYFNRCFRRRFGDAPMQLRDRDNDSRRANGFAAGTAATARTESSA
jgi:AraC-like DNA-binding protein